MGRLSVCFDSQGVVGGHLPGIARRPVGGWRCLYIQDYKEGFGGVALDATGEGKVADVRAGRHIVEGE